MSDAPALRLTNVCKTYRTKAALSDLTFSVPAGSIAGLIGPNGAGKTTCMGIVAGLLVADSGSVEIFGAAPARPGEQTTTIGIVPQDASIDASLSLRATLVFYAQLQGMTRTEAERETARVLEAVTLTNVATGRIGELSHGMRRRFSIAQALLGGPRLLLLDEPMNGLDPHVVAQMRELFRQLRDELRVTLLISSHILADLEAICDHLVFMRKGRCVQSAPANELMERGRTIRMRFRDALDGEFVSDLENRLKGFRVGVKGDEVRVDGVDLVGTEELNTHVLSVVLGIRKDIVDVTYGRSLERAYFESCVDRFEEE